LGKGDSLTGHKFRRLRVGCQQFRKARGIAARHAAFGGYAVDPDMAPGGGEASSVAGHVAAVNEAEIELGFRAQLQPGERCEIGVVGARFRHRQVEELDRSPHPGRDRIDDLDHVLRLDHVIVSRAAVAQVVAELDRRRHAVTDRDQLSDRFLPEIDRPRLSQAMTSWHTSHCSAMRSLGKACAIAVTSPSIWVVSTGISTGRSVGTMLL